jgi:hypothetical protein
MRYINTSGYNPKCWKTESQKKLKSLVACPTITEKKAFLDVQENKSWTILKKEFEKLSNYKCWFSEAYASVSDFEIEHFRPKKRVHLITSKDDYIEKRTVTDTNGYWWLSYELENFRLAAHKPNQFKGNYFPLEANSLIANVLDNSWRREVPMLLDPCIESDTRLLTYDGIEPKEANPDNRTIEHIRARISIEIYGLKIPKLKNARSRVYEEAKNYYTMALINWNAMNINRGVNVIAYDLAKINFDTNCVNLVQMLKPNKQFTRMVLAFLVSANQPWVQQYIIDISIDRKYI